MSFSQIDLDKVEYTINLLQTIVTAAKRKVSNDGCLHKGTGVINGKEFCLFCLNDIEIRKKKKGTNGYRNGLVRYE